MRHGTRAPYKLLGRYGVLRGGRFRLTMLVGCCLALAGLTVPAMSVTGRMLASSRSATGSTPASSGVANLTGKSITPAAADVAGSCSDLYFISAMGSGQGEEYKKKYNTSTIPTTGTAAEPVSAQTGAVYTAIYNQLKAQGVTITPAFYQLPYSAQPISVLTSGLQKPTSSSTLGLTVTADWIQLMDINLPKYIAGEEQGESELYAHLAQIYHTCHAAGRQPMVVLAGYSQGAMIVHNMLNTLAANNQADLASMIKGAVLIADPERVPSSDVINFGTAKLSDYGICHALDILPIYHSHVTASCVPPGTTTDVSNYFSSIAYQVCDTDDLVCDTSGLFKLKRDVPSFTNVLAFMTDVSLGKQTHELSYTSGEMRTAGRRVARSLVLDGVGSQPSPSSSPTPTPLPSTSAPPGNGSWTTVDVPLPTGVSAPRSSDTKEILTSAACPSSTCVATGWYGRYDNGNGEALVVSGAGSSWTATAVPMPAGWGAYGGMPLNVACASPSACVAASVDASGNQNAAVLVTGSPGSSWTAMQAPLPANAVQGGQSALYSVACVPGSQCVAVGTYTDTNGNQQAMVLTGLGSSWQATELPMPANAATTFASDPGPISVACRAASQCVAAGSYWTSADVKTGFLASGWGSSWTATEVPAPSDATAGTGASVSRVACSDAACAATGNYSSSTGYWESMLVTQDGASWTATQTPLPANGSTSGHYSGRVSNELEGLGCAPSGPCTAFGLYSDSSNGSHVLMVAGAGSAWTAAEAPLPSGIFTYWTAGFSSQSQIACPSSFCAVAPGALIPEVLISGQGSAWTTAALPPESESTAYVGAAACASPSTCIAVGATDGVNALLEVGPGS